ncbi:ubiquinone biosynthesis protein COQ9, mitochondrial [Condylostylus longicornis]|uniref:ubiquinone biosynthesis protein COQ9, mitochondrial n=1 Tax=Condylostylus longicornis TaxID=2530218 RepID=UPI00244E5689|nr:ubiquinone biosynthesis protein COQ9, mitochondrial [Condylostylus longicornis]
MAHLKKVMKLNNLFSIRYVQRNFSSTATSTIFLNQLYWNTNLYVAVGRNYYRGFVLDSPVVKNATLDINKKYNFSTSSSNPTVDNFRAREEAKEKEYQRQEAEKEKSKEHDEKDKAKEEKLKAVRLKILEASLPFVEQYGWTIEALINGAEKAGLPGVAHGLFPDGSIDLILHFYGDCNSKLVEYLRQETKNGEIIPKEPTEFLVKATKYRLEMLIPYKKHWPQALAKMALPQNVPKSLAQILTLIDDICYFAGDRSVDFGWYTRRIGMSTIYKLTELYMLQDKSENHQATWEFLQNRMNEAQVVELVFGQSGEPSQRTKNRLNATFETARNILGLNYDRRI